VSINGETVRALLRTMVLIRRFDETALSLRLAGQIYGVMHPYIGQEAVATGVCATLGPADRVVSNHRGHGHCIARGADPRRMMAELFGRRDGFCHGRGGSMHIADFEIGMLGANGIVAAGLPIAAGSALVSKLSGSGGVTVCFFGDGAAGEGAFHEALNISAVWKLPVVWICENNQYASETPPRKSLASGDVASFAPGYGMPGETVDGNDVLAVRDAAERFVRHARDGLGPALIECKTFRMGVHAQRGAPINEKRAVTELDAWRMRDPIEHFVSFATARGLVDAQEIQDIRDSVEQTLAGAVEYANASPFPDPADALEGVFAD
jgi:pyruvate dehydrogenase E1 component alpha subunit